MAFVIKLFLLCAVVFLVIESTKATDLKELAKALREKREMEASTALQVKESAELALQESALNVVGSSDVAVRNKRSCGGGGCGCCCCCCCCGCGGGGGCGRKKRQILTILRARRNSIAEEAIKGAANDWTGYSGGDYERGFGTGFGGESKQQQQQNGGDEDCAECDE
uniref:Uncharacterized protein n=1 Tax=Plectus sambesii TaxID=2011161 RepID=A0A914XLQ1_9BILA